MPDPLQAELKAQHTQAERAITLLETAAAALRTDDLTEAYDVRAQRMRGAAVLAHSAALELAITCGWFEAAHALEISGAP
jgi:DNA polymerase III delta prime subunit